MKGVVQARRYIGDLARIPLGKEGRGTLKAIWREDLRYRGLGSSSPGFWAEICGHSELQTKVVCDAFD